MKKLTVVPKTHRVHCLQIGIHDLSPGSSSFSSDCYYQLLMCKPETFPFPLLFRFSLLPASVVFSSLRYLSDLMWYLFKLVPSLTESLQWPPNWCP